MLGHLKLKFRVYLGFVILDSMPSAPYELYNRKGVVHAHCSHQYDCRKAAGEERAIN